MSINFIKKGRTGNNLFQYFISRILSDKYKLNFETNFFSPVLDFQPLETYKNNKYENLNKYFDLSLKSLISQKLLIKKALELTSFIYSIKVLLHDPPLR